MKIAGYIRVSTNNEGQKESPENQRHMTILLKINMTFMTSTQIFKQELLTIVRG
jgi:DNA invertase Pin-like site-specific DNA recombinase